MKKIDTRYLKYIYAGILILLLLVTLFTYRNQQNYNEEIKWIKHSNRVLRSLESLKGLVVDAETGHRGYQLTKDSTFLESLNESTSSLESDIQLLDSLLLGHEIQRKRKDSLKHLIIRQYDIINKILQNEREAKTGIGSYERNLLIMGKENMTRIRRLLKRIEVSEELNLKARLESAHTFKTIAPLTLLAYAFFALGGATLLFILLYKELDRRQKTQDELRIFSEDLQRSNEDLEQFAYVASHDLQEPLRKIRAFGDRLQVKFADQLGETGKDYIDRMYSAAERMQRLIEDLLTFSRVSREKKDFQQIDLNILIKNLLDDLDFLIESNNASVKVSQLPTINGDPAQLKRLFQNLISNSIKFKKPDLPPKITIQALTERTHNNLVNGEGKIPFDHNQFFEIEIRDNGIGFDEKYANKIFVIFQRLHGRGVFEGTGIGLAICRKIINNHNGHILARSREGRGAEFSIFFPKR